MPIVEIHPDCLELDLAEVRDQRTLEDVLGKIAILQDRPDFGKPLTRGMLRGHHRLTSGRYRILYRWDRDRDHVLVWYVGLRSGELYERAERLLRRRRLT